MSRRLTLRTLRGHYKFVGTCYACGSQSGIGGLTNFLVLAGMIIAWIGVNQYLCAYARHSGVVCQPGVHEYGSLRYQSVVQCFGGDSIAASSTM